MLNRLLKKSLAAGASLLLAITASGFMPSTAIAQTETITWKVQTVWPAGILRHQDVVDMADNIEAMSGGRLVWDVLPAGAVVGATEMLDAVNSGLVDAGHGWPGYWTGKNSAAVLFAGTLGGPYGMRLEDIYSWLYSGGGEQLYNDLLENELQMDNVVAFLQPLCCQEPLGWFTKPIRNLEDFQGLKMRSSGIGVDMLRELGVTAVVLPGSEVQPALERGVVDAVEWNNPATDVPLGFPNIAKYLVGPSARQPFGIEELLINKEKWNELPADLQAIVRQAVLSQIPISTAREFAESGIQFARLESEFGVEIINTPPDVIEAELRAIDAVMTAHSAQNPSFARVMDHMKAFLDKTAVYHNWARPPHSELVDYYFNE